MKTATTIVVSYRPRVERIGRRRAKQVRNSTSIHSESESVSFIYFWKDKINKKIYLSL